LLSNLKDRKKERKGVKRKRGRVYVGQPTGKGVKQKRNRPFPKFHILTKGRWGGGERKKGRKERGINCPKHGPLKPVKKNFLFPLSRPKEKS